jgi:N-acetylmuramoyl-L-alanine amidase
MKSQLFKHAFFIAFLLLLPLQSKPDLNSLIITTGLANGTSFPGKVLTREIEVVYKNDTKNIKIIKTIVKNDLYYGSLNDIISIFGINYKNDRVNGIFELYFKRNTLKLASNSPFVLIKNNINNKVKVSNLPVNIFFKNNEYYVPPLFFIPLLNAASDLNFTYNYDKLRITSPIPFIKTITSKGEYDISGFRSLRKANGYTLRIPSKKKVKMEHSYDRKENAISLKISNIKIDEKKLKSQRGTGIVKKIEVNKYPSNYEIVFTLDEKIESYDAFQSEKTKDIYITIFQKFSIDSLFQSERRKKQIETLAENDKNRKKWKLNVVVIDPGHGGKDPGCIGISKKYEKNINLPIALKLGKLLETKLKVKVFYTRTTDVLPPLYRRGQFANEKKGNLFISIHCNSTENGHKPNGFETYILSPANTDRAIAVAARENSVIKYEDDYKNRYKNLSDESFILTALAQNAFVRFSETFAKIICDKVSDKTQLKNNGVNQAGFYVLVGASMPSVLVECGYLSNKKDEAFLSSDKGQQKIAECIFEAIKEFQHTYEKALLEGK